MTAKSKETSSGCLVQAGVFIGGELVFAICGIGVNQIVQFVKPIEGQTSMENVLAAFIGMIWGSFITFLVIEANRRRS